MRSLNITCLTLEYPPDKGGIASYLSGLFFALSNKPKVSRPRSRSMWPRWWPMVKSCRETKADMMLTSHVLPVGTAAWIAHFFGGPAYLVIVHGLDLLLAHRSPWKRWLAKRVLRDAYLVVSNSLYTKELCQKLFQRSSLVLTPGFTQQVLPSREAARAKLDLHDDEKVVLSVGRLASRKGFDVLTETCRDLPVTLKMLHAASDGERDAWYAAADVFAYLAREEKNDVEGFGIVCLEAAAAGLPIVAGRSGGVPEAVEGGVTGILVDPRSVKEARQAILSLLEDKEKAHMMGEAGRKRVEKDFRWETRAALLESHLPLVSVIIPVFNRREAFQDCLASLTHQTYRYFEVIVMDDGSKENIASVTHAYKDCLDITYLRQKNQGGAHARNRGFDASQGTHLLFLDADAILVPQAIERMIRTMMEKPKIDVVYGNHFFGWKLFRGRPFDQQALQEGNFIHTSSLIKRASFPRFDESLHRFQDWDLWLTMLGRGATFAWIPRTLFYLKTGGTMSAWLPSFFHRVPWEKIGWIPQRLKTYREAERIMRHKHKLMDSRAFVERRMRMTSQNWFLAILILELVSALTIFHPIVHSFALVIAAVIMFVFAWRKPEIAAGLLLIEYVIGSKGALLRFGGDGLGHGGISLRIACFFAFFFGWLLWSFQYKTYRAWRTYLQDRMVYLVLFVVLIVSFAMGYARHHAFLFADANGWGAWLLFLPALDLARHEREALRRLIPSALFVAASWMIFKTLALFYFFAHVGDPSWLETIYLWVRRTGVGEITRVIPGANIWRVFFQSHIYLLPVIIGTAWYVFAHPRASRWLSVFSMGAWAALMVSLSRSLAIGVVMAMLGSGLKGVGRSFIIIMGAVFLVVALFYAPPRPLGSLSDAFASRVNMREDAAVSRWQLLPVLWQGIKQHPVLGSGFGATLTYESRDPRVQETMNGRFTTYAFEWGWLEHWFKLGIVGLACMLWIVVRLGWRTWKSTQPFWIRGALVTSLLGLVITHIFTPYLNHPLGIVWLISLETYVDG